MSNIFRHKNIKQFFKLLSCLPIIIGVSSCFTMTLTGMIISKTTSADQPGTVDGKPPLDIYIKELGQREDILDIALEAGKKLNYTVEIDNGILFVYRGSTMPNIVTGKIKLIYIIVCSPKVDKNIINNHKYLKYYSPIAERAINSNALYIEIFGFEDFVSDPKNHFKNLLQQYVDTLWALVKEKDAAKK